MCDCGCNILGGAGGKGTWGKLVEVYDEGPAKDSNDPNYDSAEEVRILPYKGSGYYFYHRRIMWSLQHCLR